MPSRSELRKHYEIVGELAPAIHKIQKAPYTVTADQYEAYLRPPHDVGASLTFRSDTRRRKRSSGSLTLT